MIDDFKPARGKRPELTRGSKSMPTVVADVSEKTFKTPEEVASKEAFIPPKETHLDTPKPRNWPKLNIHLTRKQWIIVAAVTLLVLATTGYFGWKLFHKTPAPVSQAPVVEQPAPVVAPTTIASPLTGVMITPELAQTPVTAIMIENSPDARPQSGLNQAGVVYEAVAEGGITRFLTLFQEAQPDYIGPVRSVRPYYLDWAIPFDAPIAHVGGSAEALNQIRSEGIKDLDQSFNSRAYNRVSSRFAPHNMYTSRGALLDLQKAKGFTSSSFTGFPRKDEKASAAPTARSLDFSISSFLYNPHFDYDAGTNSYKRTMAGKPHIDEKSGQQISPKVVIAIVVDKKIHPNGVNTQYGTHGSGKAFIFQDGTVVEGIWEKTDRKSQIRFGDANGAPLALNRGNTWISVVGVPGSVSFKP
ncbi:MAG: hypothetical protein JWL85_579 [Candidatus Saccharibacteria bacterium]|nr:hypothetical protein [Candidatus Saccharibacteria bacterium]